MDQLDKLQSKFVKQCVGIISSRCRSSPLLKVLNIIPISSLISNMSLDLLRNCIINDSITHGFYCSIFNSSAPKTLVSRVKAACHLNNINMLRYILNDKYYSNSKGPFILGANAAFSSMNFRSY